MESAVKVLLVTTNLRVSADVRTALAADAEFTEVRTPQRALQQFEDEGPFDIVLGDNDTAPTGGLALVRELRAREEMGATVPPVVLLIARDQDRWLARWAKPDATVLKPIDPFDLHAVVGALVEGHEVPALPGVYVPPPGQSPDLEGLEEGNVAGTMLTSGP